MLRYFSRRPAAALIVPAALAAGVSSTLAGDLPFSRVYIFADSNLGNGNVFIATSADPDDPFPTVPPLRHHTTGAILEWSRLG